jgi:hypothetical protein
LRKCAPEFFFFLNKKKKKQKKEEIAFGVAGHLMWGSGRSTLLRRVDLTEQRWRRRRRRVGSFGPRPNKWETKTRKRKKKF